MVIPVKPVAGLEGDYIVHKDNLVQRLSRHEVTNMYCSGIQIIHPKKINAMMEPVTNFYDLWKNLIQMQNLYCSNLYPNKWYAVDTLKQLSDLKDLI